jgi:CMP-N,N'-diacetyllegionaminic acid synthase
MQIVAIIPARGGSKGIPRKNVVNLAGRPLIYYTINAALTSSKIDKVIVSTEDPEISEISKKFNAEVFLRSPNLAEDDTSMVEVILHVIDQMKAKNISPDLVVLLQPTSPLRNSTDIDNAISLFLEKSPDMIISVSEFEHSPYWGLKIIDSFLEPMFREENELSGRQKLEQIYYPNGSIFLFKPQIMLEKKTFYPPKSIPYIMPRERSLDIDDAFDLGLVEFLLKTQIDSNN